MAITIIIFEGPSHSSCKVDLNDALSTLTYNAVVINAGTTLLNSFLKSLKGNIRSNGTLKNSFIMTPTYNTSTTDATNVALQDNLVMIVNATSQITQLSEFGINEIHGITNPISSSLPVGNDFRSALTAVDASAITLFTTTAASQVYRLSARILATAGTTPSATYTLKWTEAGSVITKTLTISAVGSDSDLAILIQPDNATAITVQLTAISGTGTTVNVASLLELLNP